VPTFQLDRRGFLQSGSGAFAATALAVAPERQKARISVDPAPMQRFDGFGLSQPLGDTAFAALSPAVQAKALDFVYGALPVDYFRAWVRSDAAVDVAGMVAQFKQSYLDNAMLPKISQRCHPKLILAPGMTDQDSRPDPAAYARKIAEFLAVLRSKENLLFEATGIINEPLTIPTSYIAAAAVHLRQELDRRSLQGTKVIAADWANADDKAIAAIAELEADREADAAIYAWCNHSYNMASTRRMAIAARHKQRWITEAGQGVGDSEGPPAAVNAMDAANVAGRFLTDLNQGVTRWMYFTGFLSTAFHKSPNNPWHALALVSPAGELTAFNRYFFLKGLLATFPQGSTLHACDSSLDGWMDWTYGQKPRLSAACATGPDGRLRAAIVNTTGIVSNAISKYYLAQPVRIDLQLPWRNKVFDAVVIGPDGRTRSIGAFTPGGAEGGPILNPFEMTLLVERA